MTSYEAGTLAGDFGTEAGDAAHRFAGFLSRRRSGFFGRFDGALNSTDGTFEFGYGFDRLANGFVQPANRRFEDGLKK